MANTYIKFGNASINLQEVAHSVWKCENGETPIIEVFTTSRFSVSLPADNKDARNAAHDVGLGDCYDEWEKETSASEQK